VADSLGELGGLLLAEGKLAEFESVCREELELHRKLYGDEDPRTDDAVIAVADAVAKQGRLAEAEALLREVLKSASHDPEREAYLLGPLTRLLHQQNKYVEIETLARQRLALSRKLFGDGAPETDSPLMELADLLINYGKSTEGEALLHEALRSVQDSSTNKPDRLDNLRQSLQRNYEAIGNLPKRKSSIASVRRCAGIGHQQSRKSAGAHKGPRKGPR
jgi:tetratricopeptide (TPR) repeat protein